MSDFPDFNPNRRKAFIDKFKQQKNKQILEERQQKVALKIQSRFRAYLVRSKLWRQLEVSLQKKSVSLVSLRESQQKQKFLKLVKKTLQIHKEFSHFILLLNQFNCRSAKMFPIVAQLFLPLIQYQLPKLRLKLQKLALLSLRASKLIERSTFQLVANFLQRNFERVNRNAIILLQQKDCQQDLNRVRVKSIYLKRGVNLLNVFESIQAYRQGYIRLIHFVRSFSKFTEEEFRKGLQAVRLNYPSTIIDCKTELSKLLNEGKLQSDRFNLLCGVLVLINNMLILWQSQVSKQKMQVEQSEQEWNPKGRNRRVLNFDRFLQNYDFLAKLKQINIFELLQEKNLIPLLNILIDLKSRTLWNKNSFLICFGNIFSLIFCCPPQQLQRHSHHQKIEKLIEAMDLYLGKDDQRKKSITQLRQNPLILSLTYLYCSIILQKYKHLNDQQFKASWNQELIKKYKFLLYLCKDLLNSRQQNLKRLLEIVIETLHDLNNRNEQLELFSEQFWEGGVYMSVQGQDLLREIPFIYKFSERYNFFKSQIQLGHQPLYYDQEYSYVTIRRGRELQDAYQQLADLTRNQRFKVRFVNQFGMLEQGVDGGGLFRDFFSSFSSSAFNPKTGFFKETKDKLLIPIQIEPRDEERKKIFRFIGKIVALAVVSQNLIQPVFSKTFLNILLGRLNKVDSLKQIDPQLFHRLSSLRRANSDELQEMQIYFTYLKERKGKVVEQQLFEESSKLRVTAQNLQQYLLLYSHEVLNSRIIVAAMAFRQGFLEIFDQKFLRMFSNSEMQKIISGQSKPLNIQDLEMNVVLSDYTWESPTIIYLFQVLAELTAQEGSRFLRFVTGCSRPPIGGFKFLRQKIKISSNQKGKDALPQATTCISTLSLPDYADKNLLRKKLMYALNSNVGFQYG